MKTPKGILSDAERERIAKRKLIGRKTIHVSEYDRNHYTRRTDQAIKTLAVDTFARGLHWRLNIYGVSAEDIRRLNQLVEFIQRTVAEAPSVKERNQ